jgi:hypothetical protein
MSNKYTICSSSFNFYRMDKPIIEATERSYRHRE